MQLQFPESLPVSGRRREIAEAIAAAPVVVVCGETGSGKTTQLPKICLMAGCGTRGLIGHTQPRRLAATTVARRIAEELGSPLGTDVGYKIRFNERVSPGARIKLMTDGILLAETLSDPLLRQYDTLIVDEAHERSLNIDFLLGYLKQLIEGPRRGALKLVITSATIDAARFARHFGSEGAPAPVIEVSGRLYPVEVRWRPLVDETAAPAARARDDDDETDLPGAIEDAIDELWREGPGGVLVFLPGEREIREVADHLRRAWARRRPGSGLAASGPELLPLFARLSVAEQQRVFAAGAAPRVVLATNVAETSLTVPGIRYVIDTGLARVKRYRYRGKVEQLQIEPISQAAANQRAGRCGRVSDGICIRLFDEADFGKRPLYTDPEVLRSSLASVILRMKALRLVEIEDFPFIDPPPRKAIADGYALLTELGALDDALQLTPIGRQLARLPVDPRVARMLLAARQGGCLREALVIAAALSVQDPRERPLERQQAADEAHRRYADERSDFASLVKLWDAWQHAQDNRAPGESRRALASRLEREFLSPRKLREWADVQGQLAEAAAELHWVPNTAPASYEALHRALLTGLLGNLGCRVPDEPHFLGTHATKFWLHPGSGLSRRSTARQPHGQPVTAAAGAAGAGAAGAGAAAASAASRSGAAVGGKSAGARWVMAAEMVDTARLYARTVARIEPAWIEQAAGHLIRRSWSEPHWEKRAGQVVAFERGTLYGLTLYAQRRVHYAPIDPVLSRELLIRGALVAGDWDSPLAFHVHNRRLIAEIEKLEHKIRRPDLLVDEQYLYDWFDSQLPAEVTSAPALQRWYAQQPPGRPGLLELSREQLLRKDVDGVDHRNFPRRVTMRGVGFELDYHFEPGAEDDGVTLSIPVYGLNQVDAQRCEWLVPGMLADKVAALLKSLPQKHRRHLLPLDAWAGGFVARVQQHAASPDGPPENQRPLLDALIDDLREHAGLRIAHADFRPEALAPHLSMNFRVVDEHGRFLGMSRNLAQLRADHGLRAQTSFQSALQNLTATRDDGPAPHRLPTATESPAAQPLRSAGQRFADWGFGELPELLELQGVGASGRDTLIGYPAVCDCGDSVEVQVFDDPEAARLAHRAGLRRLFALALREPLRYFEKNVPDGQRLATLYLPFGTADELRQDLVEAVLDRACLADPLPADREGFEARVAQARPRLTLIGQELARAVAAILGEHAALVRKLAAGKSSAPAVADIERQVGALLGKRFVSRTDPERLGHLSRYLKAAWLRLDKLRTDPARDAQRMAEMAPLLQNLDRARAALKGRHDPRLEEFRWLLEELRVSLFAQELRTPTPVSVKRLQRVWESTGRQGQS